MHIQLGGNGGYLKLYEQRYKRGEIAYSTFRNVRQIIKRIDEFYVSVTLRATQNIRRSHFPISPENEHLIDAFIAEHGYGKTLVMIWRGL